MANPLNFRIEPLAFGGKVAEDFNCHHLVLLGGKSLQ